MGRSGPAEPVPPDLEAGLTSPLLAPGPAADGHETTTSEREEDVEAQECEVSPNFVSRMRKVVHFWWSSSELTPCKPKLYISRLLFLIVVAALLPVALCGVLLLAYVIMMMVLVPRVVVVNYLVDPYMANSPDWGPSLIAFVSAAILGALFILDDWAERTYGKEWFGLYWSDSWVCVAAQVVLLYLFFETVYISLSTFILSFLTVTPKLASIGLMFFSFTPLYVLSLLLASSTVAILLSILLYFTTHKMDAAAARDNGEHSSSMNSLAWNTLVFIDTLFRVVLFVFLGITTLCCIYFIVYGSYELCLFLVHRLVNAYYVHPNVIPLPSLD